MFLAQLTEPEKRAFLKLAYDLVALNGVVLAETEMLAAAAREMAIAPDAGVFLGFDEACGAFTEPRGQQIALMELMLLAKADGIVQEAETVFVVRIAEAFGLGDEDVAWARRWAELVLELYRSGLRHLDEAVKSPC